MRLNWIFIAILALSMLILCNNEAGALLRGFCPDKYPSGKEFGIGTYFAPKELTIYSEPNLDSKVVEQIKWNYAKVQLDSLSGRIDSPNYSFLAFYPYKEIAIMAVSDEIENWVKVIYDHRDGSSGWVYLSVPVRKTQYNPFTGNYYSWLEFMQKIAKGRSIYFIPGVPEEDRELKGSPEDDGQPVPHKFTCIRGIDLKHIRGNWMLVKVLDYSNESPMGWIRWRDDKGELMIFCNLD